MQARIRTYAQEMRLRRIRRAKRDGRFVNRPYGPGAAGRCGHRPLRVPSAVRGMAVRAAFSAPVEPQLLPSLGGSCAAGAAALLTKSTGRTEPRARSSLAGRLNRTAAGPRVQGRSPGCFFPGFFASKESRRRRPGLQKRDGLPRRPRGASSQWHAALSAYFSTAMPASCALSLACSVFRQPAAPGRALFKRLPFDKAPRAWYDPSSFTERRDSYGDGQRPNLHRTVLRTNGYGETLFGA